MRRWRTLLLALAIAIALPAVLGCSREESRLDSLPRPVLARDLVMWSQALGVELGQVDWRAADAALESYSSELAMGRSRAADSLARALADAKPAKGSEWANYSLDDDDALRRAAAIAGQWHDLLRTRDDALFASLAGVAGIGPDVAELMRQLRAIDRSRMACAYPGTDLGPPDPLGDSLREMLARGQADSDSARRAVQEHGARIASDFESLRKAVIEDSWRIAAAARDAHIAAEAELEAAPLEPGDGNSDADVGDVQQRARARISQAIGEARQVAQAPLKEATLTQLLDTESALALMASSDGAFADAAQRTLVRYAMLADTSRTDRNIRAARFLILRDPDLDDAGRRRSIATLDTLEQVCEQLIVDAWRATLVNVRRQRANQPEIPVADVRSAIGERATEWLASLPEKTRERLEGVARNWDVAESITEGFGADTARAFRESLGAEWDDRIREPDPEPEWSAEGERVTIAEVIILPPAPTPQQLRVAAAIAGLDDAQSALFVEDSLGRWRAFLREQAPTVKSEQDAMESFGSSGVQRAVRMSMARRYYEHGLVAPLRAAQELMSATLEDLCARSAALGAAPECVPAVRSWWGAAQAPSYTDMQRAVIGQFAGPLLREADLRVARLHPDVATPEWTAAMARHSEAMRSAAQMLLDARTAAYWRLIEAITEAATVADGGDSSGADAMREQAMARMSASLASLESIAARVQLEALDGLCAAMPPREALRLRAVAARACWPELNFTRGQSRAIAGAERIRNQLREAGADAAAEQVDESIDRAAANMWDVLRAMPRADVPALRREHQDFDRLVRRHASLVGSLESLDNAAIRALRDAAISGRVPQRDLASAVLSPAPVPVTRP
ncbi:MAG: hypothetical protein FGM37_01075 [Phycisphaerales bacterium]|nr:hypothetical protein [Phycisphaerales bacterium]